MNQAQSDGPVTHKDSSTNNRLQSVQRNWRRVLEFNAPAHVQRHPLLYELFCLSGHFPYLHSQQIMCDSQKDNTLWGCILPALCILEGQHQVNERTPIMSKLMRSIPWSSASCQNRWHSCSLEISCPEAVRWVRLAWLSMAAGSVLMTGARAFHCHNTCNCSQLQ